MPLFTGGIRASSLKMFLARHARYFPRRTSASRIFRLAECFPSCAVVSSGVGAGCAVDFARLLSSTAKIILVLCERDAVRSDS